ncbi:MAG: TIGR00282 family metallophosphoesterase [Rhodospirillaceae bacterium]|nr:TIGR00282 family metallophosphoesterase [Rhodospirillaceae bacterium]|tara:strand:- start:21718 stop:22557 length:840 start_codon:yes stop_codon:yes gene_type:complete
MRILIFGDVVGRSGRRKVCEALPFLRRDLAVDFAIVNGENAAGGFGITPKICDQFIAAGADVVTTGNHVWDQKDIIPYFDKEKRLLRPHNYPEGTPGTGMGTYEDSEGRRVLVIHFMGLLFMPSLDDPFTGIERALLNKKMGEEYAAIIVDFHGEATSEKVAIGHMLDGRVSAVVGTHSHIPTADHQILPGGSGYITDLGMCGDYDSVIGMKKETSIARFRKKVPAPRLEAAQGEATLCGVIIDTDDDTGLTTNITPFREGGRLSPTPPFVSKNNQEPR